MIFYGSSTQHLKKEGHDIQKTVFPDGEISVFFEQDIENKAVYYFQSTCGPVNNHLMELLITVNSFQQKYAGRIIVIMPYFGYSRQDRLDEKCSSISAKVVADLIGKSGIHKLVVIDLHTPQLTGFFPMPVCHLSCLPLFADYITAHFDKQNCVIVSPDIGGLKRANQLAALLSMDIAIIDKKREGVGRSTARHIVGDVEDKICLLVDDMIDSGTTLITAAEKLRGVGAREIHAFATHGLFNGDAIQGLEDSILESIVVSNSVDRRQQLGSSGKFSVIDIRHLLHSIVHKESHPYATLERV